MLDTSEQKAHHVQTNRQEDRSFRLTRDKWLSPRRRLEIAKGVFPGGWKDIPEDKRNLPFVFRIALEEGLLKPSIRIPDCSSPLLPHQNIP